MSAETDDERLSQKDDQIKITSWYNQTFSNAQLGYAGTAYRNGKKCSSAWTVKMAGVDTINLKCDCADDWVVSRFK